MNALDFFNPTHSAELKAKELARQLLIQSMGQEVYVRFTKMDGTKRDLQGRLGVTDFLKDPVNGDPQSADTEELVTIFDINVRGYRSVNIKRLLVVEACGVRISVSS